MTTAIPKKSLISAVNSVLTSAALQITALVLMGNAAFAAERPRKLNVIVIITDDNCYGAGPKGQETPRIPAFFKEFSPIPIRLRGKADSACFGRVHAD